MTTYEVPQCPEDLPDIELLKIGEKKSDRF